MFDLIQLFLTFNCISVLLHIYFSENISGSNKTTILIYRFYYDQILIPELEIKKCPQSKKFIIIRSETVVDFDIVILHFMEHEDFMKEYLTTKDRSKKIMILFNFEPPHAARKRFSYYRSREHFFHWVYSYYETSYFYFPYGSYGKSKISNYKDRIIRQEFQKRKDSAVAIISNCDTEHNGRLKYVMELQKYFLVDTYGRCFNSHISREDREKILQSYKFVLSFENCNCQDYFTEKYWNALIYGAIPIVLGHNKNFTQLIPGSYINVFDFTHPKYLSQHMRSISSDINEFKKYYQWKKKYFVLTDYFFIDSCVILSQISNMLAETIREDDTIHKIGNLSICLDRETILRQTLST
uniref:Fucosyltransferase n=1 Tax=Henneguya salminicola TaxID=69463 RepID=A0A6G3MFC6_HENSL